MRLNFAMQLIGAAICSGTVGIIEDNFIYTIVAIILMVSGIVIAEVDKRA